MSGPARYCLLGVVPGSHYMRFGVLGGDHTIVGVQISRPDGAEVPKPAHPRWRLPPPAAVRLKSWRINESPVSERRPAGEQPRRGTLRRVARTASSTERAEW